MDDARRAPPRAFWPPIAVALLLIAGLYVLTLREGHVWGGDNAMYVLHAQNLLSGQAYDDTGYVHNAESGRFPVSYPPVFPLLLAPLVAIFGVAWTPMKLATIASFVAGLALLAVHERRWLGRTELIALLVVVGLNPILWDFKDGVLSEYPFLLFVCATLWIAQRAQEPGLSPSSAVRWGVCLGASIYLAYGTRSVGALLLPALFAADLSGRGRVGRASWVAVLVFAPLALFQNMLLHSEAGHLFYKLARLEPGLPLENAFVRYPQLFHDFWRSAEPLALLGLAVAVGAALALIVGLVARARRHEIDVLDGFVIGSLAFFLLIRLDDMTPPQRYWIPLFPLFVAQLLRGIGVLRTSRVFQGHERLARALVVGFVALSLLAYATRFSELELREIPRGITSSDARGLYDFIRSNTGSGDTLIFFEPRVLTLYTGRPASELRVGGDRAESMRYAEQIGARYWVRAGGLPESYRDALTMVFSNGTFSVFRFDHYR